MMWLLLLLRAPPGNASRHLLRLDERSSGPGSASLSRTGLARVRAAAAVTMKSTLRSARAREVVLWDRQAQAASRASAA